jgi:hypothetical protein
MTKFPKKYKYKQKTTIENNKKKVDTKVGSPLFPADQKLHP